MTEKMYQGIKIKVEDPAYITEFSKTLLDGFYKRDDESISESLARPAVAFCYGDMELAQRIYNYVYNGWFMYASPVLSNATKGYWDRHAGTRAGFTQWQDKHQFVPQEKSQGQPISCFAFYVGDSLESQKVSSRELQDLSTAGGGTGAHMGIRAITDRAPGPIPFEKVLDSNIGYFRQGKTRKGAIAAYMDVNHPDIIEHINFRKPGGDSKRRSDNRKQFHTAVNITDKFIDAVKNNEEYELICPHSKEVREVLNARKVWELMLENRALTGEPFMLKIDEANRKMPDSQKELGLKIRGSNLCSEIVLPTDDDRTFVCCLSSLNIEKFEEWKDTNIVQDLIRFLDNVLQSFIDNAPESMSKAKYSAAKERALGAGTLGWHGYLQSKGVPFEGGGFNSSVQHTHKIYNLIKERAVSESRKLAVERGEPDDMKGTGLRNSRLMAIAPNANSADLLDTSPSIEPYFRNVFLKDSRAGTFMIKNRHLQKLLQSKGLDTEKVWEDINKNEGSVCDIEGLTEEEKKVFKTAMEIDQHWVVEQANTRGKYICQAQSLNLFFPYGSSRKYVNSVHLKYLNSDDVLTLYYFRGEKEGNVDHAKKVERQALVDWSGDECIACGG